MFNLWYLFHPSWCGYYCLKHVMGKVTCRNKNYMSVLEMSECFKNNNYYCTCVKVSDLNDVLFGCVSLIKVGKMGYHYVVLKRMNKVYVYFYDPLFLFVRKMKITKFYKKWSKICLFYTKV